VTINVQGGALKHISLSYNNINPRFAGGLLRLPHLASDLALLMAKRAHWPDPPVFE